MEVNCKATGSYVKIVGQADRALHFCGIKIWTIGEEDIVEETEDDPE
jgi:hypothetical protein